jgi:DNA-binding Lrp family transcriptional regulator
MTNIHMSSHESRDGPGKTMPHKIDETDIRIIGELQSNARQTNQEIAEKIHLAPSTLTRRLQWLEQNKYIQGYTCVINSGTMGYNTIAYALVKFSAPTKKTVEKVVKRLQEIPEVAEVCKILGEEDLILKVYARDNDHYQEVIENIEPEEDEGFRTTTLLVTEIAYSGGVVDVIRKVAERYPADKLL